MKGKSPNRFTGIQSKAPDKGYICLIFLFLNINLRVNIFELNLFRHESHSDQSYRWFSWVAKKLSTLITVLWALFCQPYSVSLILSAHLSTVSIPESSIQFLITKLQGIVWSSSRTLIFISLGAADFVTYDQRVVFFPTPFCQENFIIWKQTRHDRFSRPKPAKIKGFSSSISEVSFVSIWSK